MGATAMEKESSTPTTKKRISTRAPKKRLTQRKKATTYCVCKGKDDGRPMIECQICQDWFHFACVNLQPNEVEEITLYVCPTCHESTGYSTIMEWEGPDVLEEATGPIKRRSPSPVDVLPPESDSDGGSAGSADDYKEDKIFIGRKPKGKNHRQIEDSDDTDESDADSEPEKLGAAAKTSSSAKKRKASSTSKPAKRQKTSMAKDESSPSSDPLRKFCLGKLEGILRTIFHRYRPFEPQEDVVDDEAQSKHTDEIDVLADRYTADLEQAMYDSYSEIDVKTRKKAAGAKYKERYRTISFNLDKSDRVTLHRRIALGELGASSLAKMSSADLASEQTKQELVNAKKESIKQTILVDTKAVPLAKITHKGEEIIESFNEEVARQQKEEEEKRERERAMRLRMPPPPIPGAGAAGAAAGGVPLTPTTPTTAVSETAISPTRASFPPPTPTAESASTPTRPLFTSTFSSDLAIQNQSQTPALDLSELIDIDIDLPDSPGAVKKELPETTDPTPGSPGNSVPSILDLPGTPALVNPPPGDPLSHFPGSVPSTPIATEPARRTSFDLDSIWSSRAHTEPATSTVLASASVEADRAKQEVDEDAMDISDQEDGGEQTGSPLPLNAELELASPVEPQRANDRDFDMLLLDDPVQPEISGQLQQEGEQKQDEKTSQEQLEFMYRHLPHVWAGNVNMPYDSNITYSPQVFARQIGGRHVPPQPDLWKILFPVGNLTVDGRVPTERSAEYLVQSRLSSSKELVAVSFTPTSPEQRVHYDLMVDFLVQKNRHGLIFPWGKSHKPDGIGRELYLVPILPTTTLPEYIDLLDHLKLPSTVKDKLLVGVWVLNKGKLQLPSRPPPSQPIAPTSQVAPPFPHSSIPPILPPSLQQPPPVSSTMPSSITSLLSAVVPQPQINISALTEEVAHLTPAQLEAVARALSHAQNPAIAALTSTLSRSTPPPPGPPGMMHPHPPPPHNMPPFPPGFSGHPPPHLPPHMQPPPQHMPPFPPGHHPSHSPPQPMSELHPLGPPPMRPPSPPRPEGWTPTPLGIPDDLHKRGGGRHRRSGSNDDEEGRRRRGGKGRDRGRDRDREGDRPRDTGWSGRGGRGRGG